MTVVSDQWSEVSFNQKHRSPHPITDHRLLITAALWYSSHSLRRNSVRSFLTPFLCISLLLAKPIAVAQTVDEQEIPKILKDAVDSRRTVGIVVGIIDAGGSKVFSYGKTGKTDADVNGNSVFEIGSVSKTFTATLLADMAERAEVSLNDPITKYLPGTVKVPTRGGKEHASRTGNPQVRTPAHAHQFSSRRCSESICRLYCGENV
jgi:CubicO group peptidase (beta-lactamase class C family)